MNVSRSRLRCQMVLWVLPLAILGSSCAVENVSRVAFFSGVESSDRILLMPADIKYYRVTASGITEPTADLTESARTNFNNALDGFATDHELRIERDASEDNNPITVEYDKLHAVVGNTILSHHYGVTKLPAKHGAFDWSLGSSVKQIALRDDYRYALFMYYRDYQASGGRIGMAVFAALLGAQLYVGHQGGFASLVDLETGNIVWFNNVPLGRGEMSDADGARRLVDQLLGGLTLMPEYYCC